MNRTPRRALAVVFSAACVVAGTVGGCSSGNSRYDEVKSDPSPNIDTLYQRPVDVDNAVIVTFDEDGRMFWQDLGRAFYWDRPSRLTREPIPVP